MKGRSVALPGESLKWCSGCQTEKPLLEFHKNCSRPDGLQNRCKVCAYASYRKSYTKHKERNRETLALNRKRSKLKLLYGLTLEDYERMVFDQNNKCAICHREMDPPHVDHDHQSSELRALLCGNCNSGLGMFKESCDLLIRAMSYLDSFKTDLPLAVSDE